MLWLECLMHRTNRVKHRPSICHFGSPAKLFPTKNDSQIAKLLRVYLPNNMQSFLLTRQKQGKIQLKYKTGNEKFHTACKNC